MCAGNHCFIGDLFDEIGVQEVLSLISISHLGHVRHQKVGPGRPWKSLPQIEAGRVGLILLWRTPELYANRVVSRQVRVKPGSETVISIFLRFGGGGL